MKGRTFFGIITGLAICFLAIPLFADQPHPWQFGFQEAVTPVMEKIHDLHNLLLIVIASIATVVLSLIFYVVWRFRASKNPVPAQFSHNTPLEIVWTLIPVLILAVIVFPSMRLLYFMDKAVDAEVTVKVVGRQWYWHYAYPDHKIEFDSVMVPDKDRKPDQLRLLAVDNELVVPVDTTVRVLVTADDVIHSWAVPAFGIKQDSIPGRLRETWLRVKKEGVYYGQCSELCGTGHGFMPIAVRVVSKEAFKAWLEEAKQKFASLTPSITLAQNKN